MQEKALFMLHKKDEYGRKAGRQEATTKRAKATNDVRYEAYKCTSQTSSRLHIYPEQTLFLFCAGIKVGRATSKSPAVTDIRGTRA
jgi:hypothetical protein